MRIIILLALIASYAFESKAENRCSSRRFQESNHCVIAGGTADTNKTINQAHARSMALKTARILAYEKLAEKVKGIMLSSRQELTAGITSKGELNTLVEAQLENVSFEEERLSFLADGSPWAEVTVSVPKMKYMDESKEALNYQSGFRNNIDQKSTFIIDARGINDSLPLFFSIVAGGSEIASYTPLTSKIKFLASEGDADALANKVHVMAVDVIDGNLNLDNEKAKKLREYLIENELTSDNPIYILK